MCGGFSEGVVGVWWGCSGGVVGCSGVVARGVVSVWWV